MQRLLERFLRYVKVETTADETTTKYPSSPGQLELGRMLVEELRTIGLADVELSEFGIVTATIPATTNPQSPPIAWFAHFDTSPEFSGKGVKPVVHRDYDGRDITLPGDTKRVIHVADTPDLAALSGKTIITTDGTTLLGADDKSGVAVITETAARLMEDRSLPCGPIRICLTCDEEIGRGVDHIDLKKLAAVAGYTLDGAGQGKIDNETFSACQAIVTVHGVNTHPSDAKGRMINAVRIASQFVARMPLDRLSPESTDDREGFLHPYHIEGGVAEARLRILLRDFDTAKLPAQADLLKQITQQIESEYPKAKVHVDIREQYRNMAEGLGKEPRAVPLAEQAMRNVGIEPRLNVVRGGTDGSRLTELGLPTPNLSTGMHDYHSPLEWACLEEMETAVGVLIELAALWSAEK